MNIHQKTKQTHYVSSLRKPGSKWPALLLAVLISLPAIPAYADVAPGKRHEISYLYSYIKNSGCTIIRNGTRHPATEAIVHIQKKYDYFRDEIKTTEDFIEYAASKSTLSGKAYEVECEGKALITTSKWLNHALQDYRQRLSGGTTDLKL